MPTLLELKQPSTLMQFSPLSVAKDIQRHLICPTPPPQIFPVLFGIKEDWVQQKGYILLLY